MPEVGLVDVAPCAGGHPGKAGAYGTLAALTGIERDQINQRMRTDAVDEGRAAGARPAAPHVHRLAEVDPLRGFGGDPVFQERNPLPHNGGREGSEWRWPAKGG